MNEEKNYSEVPRRRKKRKSKAARRRQKQIIIIISIVVIIILAAVLFVFAKLGKIGRLDFNEDKINVNEGLRTTNGYMSVALFGVDSRDVGTLGAGTHSDCIIVASINAETKEVKLASVYRDTFMDVCEPDDEYYFKCNQAYFLGGPQQAVNMLNKNLDLAITDYVTVDFKAIATVVDMLGGIDVEMTEEEADWTNKYSWDTSANTGMDYTSIPTEAGVHHLDGIMATSFARVRATTGDDLRRTERQRIVIEKILEKAKKADLLTLNSVIDKVLPLCATSFTNSEILGLAKDIAAYNMGGQTGFPIELSTKIMGPAGDCVIPLGHTYNVKLLHEFLYNEKDYKPSSTVKKLNQKIEEESGLKAPEEESSEEENSSESKASE